MQKMCVAETRSIEYHDAEIVALKNLYLGIIASGRITSHNMMGDVFLIKYLKSDASRNTSNSFNLETAAEKEACTASTLHKR